MGVKKIPLTLSTSSIRETIQKLQAMKKELSNVGDEIANELVSIAEQKISENYSSKPFKDGNDDWKVYTAKEAKGHYKAGVSGIQVLYNEFGTGTEGLNNPHDMKSKFNLKPYNSGPTIRPVTDAVSNVTGMRVGELYWTYKDKDGNTVYTQGIPAGMEVYHASEYLRKIKNTVAKRKVSGIISKV